MKPHQQRVVDEKKELDDKIDKLVKFIYGGNVFSDLPEEEQARLMRQHLAMVEYSTILGERIDAFLIED